MPQKNSTSAEADDRPLQMTKELGELPENTPIFETGLVRIFCRCSTTIKRAVRRGELPPPTRLFGAPVWLAGTIIKHIEKRLEAAAKEFQQQARKIEKLRP